MGGVRKHRLRAAHWSCPLCAAPALSTFTQLRTVPLSPWDRGPPERASRPLLHGSCVEDRETAAAGQDPTGREDGAVPAELPGRARAARAGRPSVDARGPLAGGLGGGRGRETAQLLSYGVGGP